MGSLGLRRVTMDLLAPPGTPGAGPPLVPTGETDVVTGAPLLRPSILLPPPLTAAGAGPARPEAGAGAGPMQRTSRSSRQLPRVGTGAQHTAQSPAEYAMLEEEPPTDRLDSGWLREPSGSEG